MNKVPLSHMLYIKSYSFFRQQKRVENKDLKTTFGSETKSFTRTIKIRCSNRDSVTLFFKFSNPYFYLQSRPMNKNISLSLFGNILSGHMLVFCPKVKFFNKLFRTNFLREISDLVGSPTRSVVVALKGSKIAPSKSEKGTRDGIFSCFLFQVRRGQISRDP